MIQIKIFFLKYKKNNFSIASNFLCQLDCSRFSSIYSFLYGYIDNEKNLNPEGTCSKSCSDYKKTKHFKCQNGTMCAESNSEVNQNGWEKRDFLCNRDQDIYDCTEIDAEGDIIVNFSGYGQYNYVEVNNGNEKQIYGLNQRFDRHDEGAHNVTVRFTGEAFKSK